MKSLGTYRGADAPRSPVLLWLLLLFCVGNGWAAEPVSPGEAARERRETLANLKQVFVPADRPDQWPKGDWQVIGRADYLRLLAGLKPPPPQPENAVIERTQYTAIFDGKSFRGGTFSARIRHAATETVLLPLEPLNLAVTQLGWLEGETLRPAIWGGTDEAQTLLLIPPARGPQSSGPATKRSVLNGEWSLAGRPLAESVEFDLQLAQAVVSELNLYLPATMALKSSVGHVQGPMLLKTETPPPGMTAETAASLRLWKLHLGSETQAQISTYQAEPKRPRTALVLAESDTSYVVREQELQVEARYDLDVAHAPIEELILNVPREIRVYAMTYGGDANLSWRVEPQGNSQKLILQLPDRLLGESRPIRIQGLARARLGRQWRLPRIELPAAYVVRGQFHLTVEDPLELQSFDGTGFRQTAMSVSPDQRETFTFLQVASEASLSAWIGTPSLSLAAQIVSRLTTGPEDWHVLSELSWTAQAGSSFAVECEIPAAWELIDVRRPSESSSPVIADWKVAPTADGRQRLAIEFLEALTPMQSKQVLLVARRLPAASGQSIDLPWVEPLGCRAVERFLAVQAPREDFLSIQPASAFASVSASEVPAFGQNSSLLASLTPADDRHEVRYFSATSLRPEARLTLIDAEPPFDASVLVAVDVTAVDVHERLTLSIRPHTAALDRVSLLAESSETGWDWFLETEAGQRQALGRSKPSARNPWSLSPGQEIREIFLTSPQTQPFRLVAERRHLRGESHQVTLPYLPAAHEFQGLIELRTLAEHQIGLEAQGPQEVLLDVEGLADVPHPPEQPGTIRRFTYQSSDDNLSLQLLTETAPALPTLGRLSLSSLIGSAEEGHLHRAVYELEPQSRPFPFGFRLPPEARLIGTWLDGEPVQPTEPGNNRLLPYLSGNQNHVVIVEYQCPSEPAEVGKSRSVPLPATEATILDFRWQFALSPGLRLAGGPAPLVLTSALPDVHWTTRFFGPLGRGGGEDFFAAWELADWKNLFAPPASSPQKAEANPGSARDREDFFPPDWTRFEAVAPMVPATVEFEVWQPGVYRPWAWVCLWGSLGIGLLFRWWAVRFRRQLGATWLVASLVGAGWLPLPWAMLAGGCFAGTLIALLFPRRFLIKRNTATPHGFHLGSTESFQHGPAFPLLLVGALAVGTVCALANGQSRAFSQELPPPADVSAVQPVQQIAALETSFNVMIPVASGSAPETTENPPMVVYVAREFLARLRRLQPSGIAPPQSLVSGAAYDLAVDGNGAVEVLATFQVTVLSPKAAIPVRLPIDQAFLGGPDPCLLDGQPHPVVADPRGGGFLITIPPKAQTPPDPQPRSPAIAAKPGSPAIAAKPGSPASPHPALATRQVTLKLYGRATAIPGGARFGMQIPAVPNSRLEARFAKRFSMIDVRGQQGQTLHSASGDSLQAFLGKTGKLEILWSEQTDSLQLSPHYQAEVLALLTVHPQWFEWQFRVHYVPKAGGMRSVVWHLPAQTVVQRVATDKLLLHSAQVQRNSTRLLIEFQESRTAPFTVDVACLTPRTVEKSTPSEEVHLPPLDLFGTASTRDPALEVKYRLGISATPEFSIIPPQATASDIEPDRLEMSPEKFLDAYRRTTSEEAGLRKPQFAWELKRPSALHFELAPRVPVRRVWLNQEGRIGEAELQWLATVEIETSAAAAFRHRLQVSPKLRIDSVSVQEDETERLVRWTQTGPQLDLILSDGTTGIQNVNLKGRLPLAFDEDAALPLITVENAEVVDSQLRVYQSRAAGMEVHLNGLSPLPPLSTNGDSAGANGGYQLLAGVHLPAQTPEAFLRVTPMAHQDHVETAVLIRPRADGRWNVTSLLKIDRLTRSGHPLRVHLPPALTKDFRVELAEKRGDVVPYETITNPDRSLDLILEGSSLARQPLVLRIRSFVEATETGEGTLPRIHVDGAREENAFLVIDASEAELTVPRDDEAGTTPEPVAEIPSWIALAERFDAQQTDWRAYVFPSDPWRLLPKRPLETAAAFPPGQIDSWVWLFDQHRLFGRTRLKFSPANPDPLLWHWPRELSLRGVLVDGTPTPGVLDAQAETLRLSIDPERDIKPVAELVTVEVHWSRPLESGVPRFGQLALSLPQPQTLPALEGRLTVVPPVDCRLVPQRGLEPAFLTKPAAEPAAAKADRPVFLGRLPADERWSAAFWTVDSQTEQMLLALIVLVVLGGIARRVMQWSTGEWFHRHPVLASGLLGALWWTCFAFSAAGFGVFVLALALGTLAKSPPPASLPSTNVGSP